MKGRNFIVALLLALVMAAGTARPTYAWSWMSLSELYASGNDPWYSNWFYTGLAYGGQVFCYVLEGTSNYQCMDGYQAK